MDVVSSVFKIPIRLTDERWRHIARRHPELSDARETVLEAIRTPTLVRSGESGALVATKEQDALWLVVVYREVSESDGFVITAYLTREVREEGVLWRS